MRLIALVGRCHWLVTHTLFGIVQDAIVVVHFTPRRLFGETGQGILRSCTGQQSVKYGKVLELELATTMR
jgi:hypothetical protein